MFRSSVAVLVAIALISCGTVCAQSGFELSASNEGGAPGTSVDLIVTLDNPAVVEGFSFGLAYDGDLVALSGASQGAAMAATHDGDGADFFFIDLEPTLPSGVNAGAVVGCLVSLSPPFDTMQVGVGNEVAIVHFDVLPGATVGAMTGVDFTAALGAPAIEVVISVNGLPEIPSLVMGSIEVEAAPLTPDFSRGDCNDDGAANLADAVSLLGLLFPTGAPPVPPCLDACDANDDGAVNLGDAIATLGALFGTPIAPLPAPYPGCGLDTTPSAVTCGSFSSCP